MLTVTRRVAPYTTNPCVPAMLVYTIDLYHFTPLSVTLILTETKAFWVRCLVHIFTDQVKIWCHGEQVLLSILKVPRVRWSYSKETTAVLMIWLKKIFVMHLDTFKPISSGSYNGCNCSQHFHIILSDLDLDLRSEGCESNNFCTYYLRKTLPI